MAISKPKGKRGLRKQKLKKIKKPSDTEILDFLEKFVNFTVKAEHGRIVMFKKGIKVCEGNSIRSIVTFALTANQETAVAHAEKPRYCGTAITKGVNQTIIRKDEAPSWTSPILNLNSSANSQS